MDERRMQFRVGVVVFATMIVGVVLTTLYSPVPTSWLPWGHSTYGIGIKLSQAPGIGPNTPVRKNGILIGRVESIEDQDDGVIVRTTVDTDRALHTGHVPHVRTTVLGDATIDFIAAPTRVAPQPLTDGAVIPGVVDPHPLDSIARLGDLQEEFAAASRALTRAGNEVGDLAERVNNAFGDETEEGRVTRLLDTTERAMNQFSQTMSAMNDIFGDDPSTGARPANWQQPAPAPQQRPYRGAQPLDAQPIDGQFPAERPLLPPEGQLEPGAPPPIEGPEMRRRLREGLHEMPEAVRDIRRTMEKFRGTLELADRNLRNLEGFTEPLGEKGDEIAASLIDAVQGLDSMLEDFSVLTRALNNREGTIGRLIYDAQVYDNLNRLMCNANTVLAQIHELAQRLRPVVEDARVFMDKIAREPSRIVSGALSPNPSITK